MRLEWAFRVSGYLTLALACLCLGLAATPFIHGLPVLAAPLLLVLVVACCLEGRVALPAWAANLLGIVIALGGTVWMGWHLYGQIHETGLEDVPMPAALLPFLGPLLIVLMLVKLLRPKQPVDYWVLQGLGLILVTLSCVLGTEPVSGMLLLAYLACGLWHLAIFHVHRETIAASGGRKKSAETARVSPAGSLVRAVLWTGSALVIGLPLFLLLPRQGQSAWNPYRLFGGAKPAGVPRIVETGFTNEIDLTLTGVVEITDEVAFTVQVQDNQGEPKLDLSADQSWRGAVLEYYVNGRWRTTAPLIPQIPFGGIGAGPGLPAPNPEPAGPGLPGPPLEAPPRGPPAPPPLQEDLPQGRLLPGPTPQAPPPPRRTGLMPDGRKLPDLGPGQFYLTFAFQARTAGGLFLAEPVVWRQDPQAEPDSFPVISLGTDVNPAPLFDELHQTLQPGANLGRGEYRYRQVTRPPQEPGLSEPVDRFDAVLERPLRADTNGVGEWTEQLVQRLADKAAFGLTRNNLERVVVDRGGNKAPRDAEKVAVALTEYLARSGEYTYTLDRRREDTSIDPTLDFLQNVKQGHCERFAGALALMLRSLGIQARVVTGFRGAESRGDGVYVIRHNFAHSWVEVLVKRAGSDGLVHTHWRMLDPTPATEAPPPSPFSWARWWENHRKEGEMMWKELILNYGGEQQDALLRDTWDWMSTESAKSLAGGQGSSWRLSAFLVLAAIVAGPAFRLAFRLWPRARFRSAARLWEAPFYNRLLVLLARNGRLHPLPAQTPREFAEAARRFLTASPSTSSLADIPAHLVTLLYRVRYGNQPLSEQENHSIEGELQRLATGLAR